MSGRHPSRLGSVELLDTVTQRAALFVTTVASTLEAFLLALAGALRSAGWRVDALARGAEGRTALQSRFDQLFDAPWSRRLADPGNFIGAPGRVRELVAAGGYDVVHVHTPIAGFVSRYALRGMSGPSAPRVIYTVHGFHFFEGGSFIGNTVFRRAERTAARWTDYLVTMNREDFEAARSFGTIPQDRIRLVPGVGVDPATYRPNEREGSTVRTELGIESGAFVVTMIAEMNANKRHALVLDAFSRMRQSRASSLIIVGEGPLLDALKARAASLNVHQRVHFVGHRSDVPAVLAGTDVLTLVSRREGMPRTVLEAMSTGVPVVGTRTRGIIDAVDDTAGWLVDGPNPDALAAALDFVAEHPDRAHERGATGRELVLARYSEATIVDAYLDLYREAIAQSHG